MGTPILDKPEDRRPRNKLMRTITVRVDDQVAEQLQDIAAAERETTSTIIRRFVLRGLSAAGRDVPSLARAREGTGRVR